MGEKKQEQFSVDEILEEHRKQQKNAPARPAPQGEPGYESAPQPEEEDKRDIGSYATSGPAGIKPADEDDEDENEEQEDGKKKRGLFGLFGKKKKKKKPDFVDGEETFYGIQLKPIDEYRKGYNQITGEFSIDASSYATLFEESKKAIDDGEVEKNFERIQRERRARTEQSVEFSTVGREDRSGIVPPSHARQAAAPEAPAPAQKAVPNAHTQHTVPSVRKEQTGTRQPVAQTASGSTVRPKPRQNDGRVQVIPKVSSIYEYRSHGIPTHIINVKSLQDALSSRDIYRVAGDAKPSASMAKPSGSTARPSASMARPPLVTQEPSVQERPAAAVRMPAVEDQPEKQAPSMQERKPAVREQKQDPSVREQTAAAVQMPAVKEQQEPSIREQTAAAVQVPAVKEQQKPSIQEQTAAAVRTPAVKEQPAAAKEEPSGEMTATMKIPAIKRTVEPVTDSDIDRQQTMKIPALDSAEQERTRKPVQRRMPVSEDSSIGAMSKPSGSKAMPVFEEVSSRSPEAAAEKPDQEEMPAMRPAAMSTVKEQPRQKWVEPEESAEDYNGPGDAKAIADELKSDMRDLTLRMIITGGCTLALALINLIFGGTFSSGQADLGSTPYIYIILTLIFLGVAIAVNYRTILNGLKALIAFNATSDSSVAVATVGVCIQTFISFFFTSGIVDKEQHLYAAILTAALVVNAAGKLTMLRRIHSNFRFVTSKEQKYAVHVCKDEEVATKMAGGVVVDNPVLVYQSKTGFLKRFLEMSYLPDPAETSSQMFAPIGLIASLVLCIICMLITKSIPSAISAMAAALIASVAVTNMLAVNMPISRLSKVARRAGGMLVGYEAVNRFGDTNAVAVDAQELFPTGTVTLNGIKTYLKRDDVEEAILAASALVDVVGGPLVGVFEQVITENEENLPKVETFEYEYERGMVGRVDGRKVYVGNRALLLNHRVELPAKEEEAQYAVGGKQVLYIAVEMQVVAMMVMTYTADRRKKNEIQRLEDSGISVVVRSTDPNITVQLLSRLFGVDALSLSVMNSEMSAEYQALMSDELARSDAVLATKGRVESLISLVSACVKEKRNVSLIIMLQTVAVVLGFVLVAFMACFGAIGSMTSFILFLFEAVWAAIILLFPKLRR